MSTRVRGPKARALLEKRRKEKEAEALALAPVRCC